LHHQFYLYRVECHFTTKISIKSDWRRWLL